MAPPPHESESASERLHRRIANNFYEDLCRREVSVILDGWLEAPVLADRDLIDSKLLDSRQRDAISRHEYLDGLRPDIVARGSEDSGHAGPLAVVEVSVTFNRMDLENAANRAGVIAKVTGLEVIPFLVTHSDWPDEVNAVAEALGVSIIRHEDPNAPPEVDDPHPRIAELTRVSNSG